MAAIEKAGFVEVTISEKALDQAVITSGAEQLGLEIDVEGAQRVVYSARVTAIKPR